MADVNVTQILQRAEGGDARAAEQLLPLVYDELRRLADMQLAREKPGHTLQATALVHEAYLRLVGGDAPQPWQSRRHFFLAAGESMRRILIDHARRKAAGKRGGQWRRQDLDEAASADPAADADAAAQLLDLDQALTRLAQADPVAARLVELRYFAGLTMDQAAAALEMSTRNAYYTWTYAKSWLHRQLRDESPGEGS